MPSAFAIEIAGSDAAKVVNNVSTNDLLKLPMGDAIETFVTDVRGWIVTHALVVKQTEGVWLAGSHPDPAAVCRHLERYIIRENAVVRDRSHELSLLLASPQRPLPALVSAVSLFQAVAPILCPATLVMAVPTEQRVAVLQSCLDMGGIWMSQSEFAWRRITSFWPLAPDDFAEKALPQELDRDQRAISFIKGCYLGQETIARLDARGQLQKKLCLLEISADTSTQTFQAGAAVMNGDQPAGTLTSVAHSGGQRRALALLRRGNLAVGTQLRCQDSLATVIAPP